MTTPRPAGASVTLQDPAVAATAQLTCLLDRLGDALTAVDTTALLDVEGELGAVLAALDAVTSSGDPAAARAAAAEALTKLDRCRRLGASFAAMARAMTHVAPAADPYDRSGGYVERAARSSVLVRA